METIKRSTLGEQILDSVLDIIRKNNYMQGDKLPTEKELSETLGVGRNSVREAMKTLNMVGITRSIAGKGTFLLSDPALMKGDTSLLLDSALEFSLLELLEARRMIETEAAARAAAKTDKSTAEWGIFSETTKQLIDALQNKTDAAAAHDFNFHICLVKLSGNRFLHKMLHSIVSDIQRSKKIIAIDFDNAAFEIAIHTKIYEACVNGDVDAVKKCMETHFENTIQYCKNLSQRN